MEIIVYWLVFGVIFGALGAWIANEKHRDQGEGFILGFLFCPLGVIIEAVLPNPPQAVLEPTPQPTAEELARQRELLEQQREQQRQEEAIRRQVQQLAEQQRQEEHAQHDRQEAESRLARERLAAQAHEENLLRREQQRLLARQRRHQFFASIPEETKIIIGVIGGVLATVILFAAILSLVPK